MGILTAIQKILTFILEAYKKHFPELIGLCFIASIISFVANGVLLKTGSIKEPLPSLNSSLLSYYFSRVSYEGVYSLVDLSKIFFLYIAGFIALGVARGENEEQPHAMNFGNFIKNIGLPDFISLTFILAVSCIFDAGIYYTNNALSNPSSGELPTFRWIVSLLYHVRIYLPFLLFVIIIQSRLFEGNSKYTFKMTVTVLLAMWLVNEVAYELLLLYRNIFVNLILIPFQSPDLRFLLETLLGMPAIAAFFIGFACVMNFDYNNLIESEPKKIGGKE